MAQLPAQEAIVRFVANENRLDGFVNGPGYTTSSGEVVPNIPTVLATIAAFNSRGVWAAITLYSIKDLVLVGSTWYACIQGHTSSAAFVSDESSKWRVHQRHPADYISVMEHGAVSDGLTDDSASVFNANFEAGNRPLMFIGVTHIGMPTTITAPIVDTMEQIFSVTSLVTIDNGLPVRPEWWGNGERTVRYAVNALPSSGGVVQLEDRTYKPNHYAYGYSGAGDAITKPNVTLLGRRMPRLANDCKSLTGGTIIQGLILAYSDNFEARDLGVDCGFTVNAAYAATSPSSWDALLLTYPSQDSKNAAEIRLTARLHNIIGLCPAPSTAVHAMIVGEGYKSVTCTGEMIGVYGVHGIVIKASEVVADQLTAYGNNSNGVIIKSDAQASAISNDIQISKIRTYAAGGPSGWTPYLSATAGYGLLFNPSGNITSKVQIGSVLAIGHPIGIGVNGSFVLDNVQMGLVTTDNNSSAGIALQTEILRMSIDSVVNRNTPVGISASWTTNNTYGTGRLVVTEHKAANCAVATEVSGRAHYTNLSLSAANCTSGAARVTSSTCSPIFGFIIRDVATPATFAADSGGLVPVLENSWANFGGGSELFGVDFVNGSVLLKGLLIGGTTTRVLTLPVWLRPPRVRRFLVLGMAGAVVAPVQLTIGTGGEVTINEYLGGIANVSGWLSLEGVVYSLQA